MNEVEQLERWMQANGYDITALAKAVGMSYDGTYQIFFRKRVSDGFKLRFIWRFGIDAANQIFTSPLEAELCTA